MIKAIIFDLNGVLMHTPRLSDKIHQEFDVSIDEFMIALTEIMGHVRMPGAGDAFEYWQPHFKKWGVNLNREEFFNFWFKDVTIDSKLVELLKDLRTRGVQLFILSNNFKERSEYYQKNFKLLSDTFIKVYYSWQTGFVKPDPRAYKNILTENNLKAEECLYVDDSTDNVKLASNLGIKSFVFKGSDNLKKILQDHQLL